MNHPEKKEEKKWRNWGDHPIVVFVGVIAGLIAIIGFFTGFINFQEMINQNPLSPPVVKNTPTTETVKLPALSESSSPFSLAGDWSGTIKSNDDSFSTALKLSFDTSCSENEICGTYDAYQLPCSGTLTLIRTTGNTFVFFENKTNGEDWCGTGGLEHVTLQPDDNLFWEYENLSQGMESTATLQRDK